MIKNDNHLRFFMLIILICISAVILHEIGHAIIYTMQGFNVDFNLTKANPVSGEITLLGSMGGLLSNLIIAIIFLFLYKQYKKILFFVVVFAHTWFSRLFLYLLKLPRGYYPTDEMIIARHFNLHPLIICSIILILFSLILYKAFKILLDIYSKNNLYKILIYSFSASLLSMFVIIPLEG